MSYHRTCCCEGLTPCNDCTVDDCASSYLVSVPTIEYAYSSGGGVGPWIGNHVTLTLLEFIVVRTQGGSPCSWACPGDPPSSHVGNLDEFLFGSEVLGFPPDPPPTLEQMCGVAGVDQVVIAYMPCFPPLPTFIYCDQDSGEWRMNFGGTVLWEGGDGTLPLIFSMRKLNPFSLCPAGSWYLNPAQEFPLCVPFTLTVT